MAHKWYVVNTKSGGEEIAAINLRRQDFEVFLPRALRVVRHARQIRNAAVAFFPSYFFVQLDLERDRWRAIEGTCGVRALIKANERPLPAPTGFVDALKAACTADGTVNCASALQPGDRVRINAGPFADQLAVVSQLRGQDRVEVLLSLMKHRVPVDVGRRDLALI